MDESAICTTLCIAAASLFLAAAFAAGAGTVPVCRSFGGPDTPDGTPADYSREETDGATASASAPATTRRSRSPATTS